MKITITQQQYHLLNLIKKSRSTPIAAIKPFLLNAESTICTLNSEYLAILLKYPVAQIRNDLEILKAKKLINTITLLRIRYIELIENKTIKIKKINIDN